MMTFSASVLHHTEPLRQNEWVFNLIIAQPPSFVVNFPNLW